jgi:hypothetical protein
MVGAASVNCRWIVERETDLPAGSIFQCRPVSRDGIGDEGQRRSDQWRCKRASTEVWEFGAGPSL